MKVYVLDYRHKLGEEVGAYFEVFASYERAMKHFKFEVNDLEEEIDLEIWHKEETHNSMVNSIYYSNGSDFIDIGVYEREVIQND